MINPEKYISVIPKRDVTSQSDGTTILLHHQLLREGFRCAKNAESEGVLIAVCSPAVRSNYRSQTWALRYVGRLEHISSERSFLRNIF